MTAQIIFDKNKRAIMVNGKNIVDLRDVPDGSIATIYPKNTTMLDGYETTLTINYDSLTPFNLDFAELSASTFVRTIVENKLKVQGMKCSDDITDTCETIKQRRLKDILNN